MNFLYWLYSVAYLWFAQRRGQRPVSAAEYCKTMENNAISEGPEW
jgi:hypothetical protein